MQAAEYEQLVDKIDCANEVLESFSVAKIVRRQASWSGKGGGWFVEWEMGGKLYRRRWMTRGQDFYPVWSRIYPGGGTSCTALSQLIRWLRGQPVLPISTWRYWADEQCKLLPLDAVEKLLAGGYPADTPCVLCGEKIAGSLDWWSLDGVSGPCCGWTSGCRQEPKYKIAGKQ